MANWSGTPSRTSPGRQAVELSERFADGRASWEALRSVLGDPFRSQRFEPGGLTLTVVDLAREIHDNRAFEQMPMLGDALEETGCTSAWVLDHCWGTNHHVRGC